MRNIKKSLSAAVLAGFCVQFVFSGAWALVDVPALPGENVERPSGEFARLDIATFTVPEHIGEVKVLYKGSTDKFVVHIQDAHCNRYAQHRIADLINYLNAEYGIRTVNLEGGVGEYDFSVFDAITGDAIRREVADYFVKKSELNGAEYFAITNPGRVMLWGVEEMDLYLANLKIYKDSLVYKPVVSRYLQQLSYMLDNLKMHIFSSELLEIDKTYSRYKSGELKFRDYVEFLFKEAKACSIPLGRYVNLSLLVRTMEQEKKVDFDRANSERRDLIDGLKNMLSENESRELLSKTVDFKTKKISRKTFYGYLIGKAEHLNMDIGRFPALESYIAYISTCEDIDHSRIMEELDELEGEITGTLYRNLTERVLNGLSRNLALLKNIFDICLIKTDYRYYLKNMDAFNTANFTDFSRKESPKYRVTFRPDADIFRLDEHRENLTQFYELSFTRDRAFLKNIRYTVHGPRPPRPEVKSAILITGGFHTESLCELLEERDISHVSILPKFTTARGWVNPYFEILAGETTSIQQALRSAVVRTSMLQIASRLTSLGTRVWGEAGVRAFKAAVRLQEMIIASRHTKRFKVYYRDRSGKLSAVEREGKELIFGDGDAEPENILLSDLLAEKKPETSRAVDEEYVAGVTDGKMDTGQTEDAGEQKAAEKTGARALYEEASGVISQIAGQWRKNVPTYVIEPSISDEDRSPVMSYLRSTHRKMRKDGHRLSVRSYDLTKDDWAADLEWKIDGLLDDFVDDSLADRRTRMVIRLALKGIDVRDSDKIRDRIAGHIRENIEKRLREMKRESMLPDIMSGIKFVNADIGGIRYVNTTIDLLTDITGIECQRYGKGEEGYSDRLPEDLARAYLRLLRLSIDNFDDFGVSEDRIIEAAETVLEKIFKGLVVLKIRKIDWESIRQWKDANDEVLRAL
ncbi:MAG: hypothetical protein KAS86_01255 [Candidatus Omnitrophica bacterium]|nr:hypothetical protein [Candidatus Omnitrophota bacterium]